MFLFNRRGFTLIELLIVVAIIAILAAIAVPNFIEAQTRSKVSRVRTDMRTAATALESYAVDYSKYPPEMREWVQAPNGTALYGYKGALAYHSRTGHNRPRIEIWRTLSVGLTTPVSYLSSVMKDTFKQNRSVAGFNTTPADSGFPFETGNPFDSTFNYHNIQMRSNSGILGYNQEDFVDYGAWRIFSLGPMGFVWSIGTSDPTMGWKYDATNGTMSSGYILRTQKDATGENFSRSN